LTLSTATLFNDRNNANISQVNQMHGRISIVQGKKNGLTQSLCGVTAEPGAGGDCSTQHKATSNT